MSNEHGTTWKNYTGRFTEMELYFGYKEVSIAEYVN